MPEQPIRIAVSGYYGCGNTGDEAVLAGIVESFARRAGVGAAQFTVLSQDPADTEQRHGLLAVDRMNLSAVRGALRECDLLLSGGGSLLQDTTSVRSLLYYLWIARMGLKAGVPVMFYAQGIGPLRRPVSRFLTRLVASRAAAITVRDSGSADLLRQIGVRTPPIQVTADPAFALTPALEERVEDIRQRAGIERGRKTVGIALRPWRSGGAEAPVSKFAALCGRVAESTGAQIVFLPMQPPGDLAVSTETAALMSQGARTAARIVQEPLLPREALGLVASMDGLIAMRLHALIFAAAGGGVPMVSISYDPKVTQLMEGLGQGSYNIGLEDFEPERAAELLILSINRDAESLATYRQRAGSMAELSLANVDAALRVVRREPASARATG